MKTNHLIYRASNPVVRDDAKLIAFQGWEGSSEAGARRRLYLFDIKEFEKAEQ